MLQCLFDESLGIRTTIVHEVSEHRALTRFHQVNQDATKDDRKADYLFNLQYLQNWNRLELLQ